MFQINTRGPIYDPAAVQPMRDELTAAGFTELLTPADVDTFLG
ncbi:MAG TPA: BrxA/BrxB family bacilliredoxin, partial [Bacteroidetes bacterium]|nr:BrxA/BrxB family bacilliredoxin [Bacteroidota bacterium]